MAGLVLEIQIGDVQILNSARDWSATQEILNRARSLADWFRASTSLSASQQQGSRVEESLCV